MIYIYIYIFSNNTTWCMKHEIYIYVIIYLHLCSKLQGALAHVAFCTMRMSI